MSFRLVVRKHGVEFTSLELKEDREYSIGRNHDCTVILDPEKGISRHHARIFHNGNSWIVENQSRMGSLIVAGSPVESAQLYDQSGFSIPPFEFLIEKQALVTQGPTSTVEEHEAPQPQDEFNHHPMETTRAGVSRLVPYLKVTGAKQGNGILKLDGDIWFAGREKKREIFIDDGHVSRKHFELTRTSEGFFITDLGSANGTFLNDEEIPAHEPIQVLSGDRIKIMNVSIDFEIRDESFEQRVEKAKAQLAVVHQPLSNPMMSGYPPHPEAGMLIPHNPNAPGAIPITEDSGLDWRNFKISHLKNIDYKKHKIRIIIGLLLPFLLFGILSDKKSKPKKGSVDSASESVKYDSLTQEQKAAVKDIFTLAQQHYKTLKYELCLAELQKLHDVIPSYENSRQLETFCQQGSILLQKEKDREARERKKRETELKIATVVEDCKNQLENQSSEEQALECMSEAVELDPEHQLIVNFLNEIRLREQKLIERQEDDRRRHQRILAGKRQYLKARQLVDKNNLSRAIAEYNRFLKGGYPSLTKEKQMAKRELASVRSVLNEKIERLLATCQELRQKGEFKQAWLSCNEATREDPGHSKAQELKQAALSDLRREMKSIYQDSILEESLGNVDAAKEKWKQIMERDLETDEYYKKAERKLKKYGIGI